MRSRIVQGFVAVSVVTLCACATEVPVVEQSGECSDAFGAQVCTWAKVQGSTVVEVGATVPLASIENAPKEAAMAWPPTTVATANLPESVRESSGLTHLTMYWEPMGHAPATYMVPHFDFHFYLIPSADRLTIDCSDLNKPASLPAAYSLPDETLPDEVAAMIGVKTLVGICVPEMGMHALPTAELSSETPFRGTMVVGYYHGAPVFLEPMLSQAMLLERQSFDLAIPAVPGLEGAHPTMFRAEYDAGTDAFRFVFSALSPAI